MKSEVMWFIEGDIGGKRQLYCGGSLTRKDAQEAHIGAFGEEWPQRRRKGDRTVKCLVTPIRRKHSSKGGES